MKAYASDLAYIHDVGFGHYAAQSAAGLLEHLKRADLNSGLIVDLGCGSGIWAERLIRAGYDVLGIDLSEAMVRIASRRVPKGQFRVQSYLDANIPPCAAVTSIGECLNYLFDDAQSQKNLFGLFGRIYEALHPGGLFIFDVAIPGRATEKPRQRYFLGDDWAVLVETVEDRKLRRLTRAITTFRQAGKSYRRDSEVHHLQLYEPKRLTENLQQIGFHVRTLRRYGDFRLPKGIRGFVARKPK